ncbi:hypothetical protein [Microbacterium esteraromaticum]|uniref:hypothetical protein n=1 Tax=Microbacterium esteraromaticum TaxID=57043 RepID=UPI001956AC8B|nr:hypothetical protein [Microbacterium esteraromaticum]MBM7467412.1 hypothetical protein [Microbacterium esteraromaticum]
MTRLEDRYRRLLRWYPLAWRLQNGEALIGTALDAAEAEARTRPTVAEAREMILHGIAHRATVRAALSAAVLALLCTAASQVVAVTSIETVGQWGGGWIPLALGTLSSLLQSVTLLALLRHAGRMHPGRFAPVLLVAAAAWSFAFLAAWSWSIGFDRADAGLPHTPFTEGLGLLLLCGWVLGGVAAATLISELGHALPRTARTAAAAVAGIAAPPLFGSAAMLPSAGVLPSLILIVFCVRRMTVPAALATTAPAVPFTHAARPFTHSSRAILLATAILGLASVVFALAGGGLVPAIDATRAMQIGLASGALSGIPLLGIGATRLVDRHPARRVPIWCATALLVAAVAVEAAIALSGAGGSGDVPWAAVAPAAAGVGLLTWALTPVSLGARLVLDVAVSAASLFPLWFALTAVGLLLPPLAAIVAVRAIAARRRQTRARAHPALP